MVRLIRARLPFVLLLIGVASGAAAFAVGFRAALGWLYRHAYHAGDVVTAIAALPLWLRVLVPAAGAAAGSVVMQRATRAQSMTNVMEAVALGNVRLSMKTTAFRVAASWMAIASGLSIGREGPLIEFGGALGASLSARRGVSLDDTRLLIAAGTAAGFAAAYNTPFAAVLFVLETMVGIAAVQPLSATMAAAAIATAITRAVLGGGPIYGERAFFLAGGRTWLVIVLLGISAAAAAWIFKRVLFASQRAFERLPFSTPWRAAAGGLLVGATVVFVPMVAGNGYEPLNAILDNRLVTSTLALLFVAKMFATSASVASGLPGGIFTPTLLLGGLLGSLAGSGAALVPDAIAAHAGSYVLLGMAAMTAASIHAPLTAAVLVFELSSDYGIVLPLLVVTVVATGASRLLGSESVYVSELRRRGLSWDLTLEGRTVRRDQ